MQRLLTGWSTFWFAPTDARTLAAMRISLAVLLLASHALMFPDLVLLFSDAGPVTTEAVLEGVNYVRWTYLDGQTEPGVLLALHGLAMLPMVGLLVGWQSRWMALLVLLVQIAIHHRAPWAQHGGDRVLRISTLALLLAPCGAAWSVDAWRARRRAAARGEGPSSPLVPVTTHRLVQIQTCIVYLFTGLEKVVGGSWQRGDALYYALSLRTFQRLPALTEALLGSGLVQLLLKLLTWLTLGWELAFAALVLWRPTRRAALLIGVLLHVGIAASMMVGSFSFAMVWCYLAFLEADTLRRWLRLRPDDA